MSGLFSDIGKAEFAEGGVYFLDGNYVVEVEQIKSGVTRQDLSYFVVECRILQSTNPLRKPGTIASWFVGIRRDTPALADIKRFLAVAGEVDDNEVDEAAAEMSVSDEQPFAGRVLRAVASTVVTKKNKRDFTKVVWSNFEGTEGDVAAMKKAAGL